MIGIISAMNKEVELLIQLLNSKKQVKVLNQVFWVGHIDHQDIVITVCGIGKVNAGVGSALMIEHFKPRLIINTGVAGGFSENLKHLDVVIGTKIGYYDVDLTADGQLAFGQLPNLPLFFEADELAISIARDSSLSSKCHEGIILSADIFASNRLYLCELFEKHLLTDTLAVDMESASIAQVCYDNQTPFLIIRSISDVIGHPSQTSDYYEWVNKAAYQALTITQFVIKNY